MQGSALLLLKSVVTFLENVLERKQEQQNFKIALHAEVLEFS
jgi:hypothetical protein